VVCLISVAGQPDSPLQQLCQNIAGWMRVSLVLAETFAAGESGFGSASSAPASAGFGVFIHAVLSPQPLPLTGMAGQRGNFCLQLFRDVDDEVGGLATTKVVGTFHRIHKVQPWNLAGHGAGSHWPVR